jgi:predicted nuclease with TOPRIM domain
MGQSKGAQAVNPQHEAHERFCKSIGDMAKENERLQERIKQLEESLESANTLLQLVMCEQNHLRDLRNKANDRIKLLEEAGDALANNHNPFTFIDWTKAKESKP